VCPDASCDEASDEDTGDQCTAEERLRPELEARVEDTPLREKEVVRRIVSGDCGCMSPGLVPSSVFFRWNAPAVQTHNRHGTIMTFRDFPQTT